MKRIVNKFKYAFRGLTHGVIKDNSIRVQYLLAIITIVFFFGLCDLETNLKIFIIILISLVIAFEYINSAIELIVDSLVDHYDENAKVIKDYAAAAVLVIAIAALIVAAIILFK